MIVSEKVSLPLAPRLYDHFLSPAERAIVHDIVVAKAKLQNHNAFIVPSSVADVSSESSALGQGQSINYTKLSYVHCEIMRILLLSSQ